MGAALSHADGQTYERTDRHDQVSSVFRSFANAPTNAEAVLQAALKSSERRTATDAQYRQQ